jgi:hypothetical protein
VTAWAALEETLNEAGYGKPKSAWIDRPCSRGINQGKPCQQSGENCSLHNYGLAIDIDPNKNPYFQGRKWGVDKDFSDIKLTRAQVDAVEGLKTVSGVQVFKWLGWSIADTMHFEITCRPEDLATGIPGVEAGFLRGQLGVETEEDDMFNAEEEKFLKDLFKVVVKDMGSNATLAKSAILDIRKDIITRNELIAAIKDLPQGDVDAALAELLRRLSPN